MHLANSYYGHRAVLADYVGLGGDRPIWGMLQHGWNPGTGFTPDDPPQPIRRWVRAYVWNRDNLETAKSAGYHNVHATGAPFIYLGQTHPGDSPTGTLVYPFHAWEQGTVETFHDSYAEQVREREGQDATVCLYWLEYEDATVRAAYEARDLRVICHGHREDDPSFLRRQHETISAHRRVVANRAATALWYGGWLGREIEVYGPEVGTTDARSVASVYADHRARWPEVFDGPLDVTRASELAARELGAEFHRSPSELKALLGWVGGRASLGPVIAAVTHPAMRLKRRLEGW